MGFSGRLNTAFIERVNLTVRHGVAALARRTWATAKPAPYLLAHLEWWRASSHFVRPHAALRIALGQPAAARGQVGGATLPPAYGSSGSGENQPTMDCTRGALLPIASGSRLRATQARCGGSVRSWRGRCKCQQKKSDGTSFQDEVACPNCPMTKRPARSVFTEVDRIIHHQERQYQNGDKRFP
jgi:hypothetical protein